MIQWNSSNPDTSGREESVHISEVSLFQGLNHMQKLFLGKEILIFSFVASNLSMYSPPPPPPQIFPGGIQGMSSRCTDVGIPDEEGPANCPQNGGHVSQKQSSVWHLCPEETGLQQSGT